MLRWRAGTKTEKGKTEYSVLEQFISRNNLWDRMREQKISVDFQITFHREQPRLFVRCFHLTLRAG